MLRAEVQFNSASNLAWMPGLLEQKFGIGRRGQVGSCFVAQIAYTIAVTTGIKASTVATHVFKHIGIRGSKAGWTLEEVVKTFEHPILTRTGPRWLTLGVFKYETSPAMLEAILLGHPVMIIMDRTACDVIENEARSYEDGAVMASVIRGNQSGLYHAFLAMGIDAVDKYVMLRDTRDEYSYKGYLRVKEQILRDGWKNLCALSVVVMKDENGTP